MTVQNYRYQFQPRVEMIEVEASLLLALLATESLHGETKVKLEAIHALDTKHQTCEIDASSEVGQNLNRLFTGFLLREFSEEAFRVEQLHNSPDPERAYC